MMKPLYALCLALLMSGLSHAGIVIQVQDGNERTVQYFEDGRFLLVQDGRPGFGIEPDGTCWFVAEGQRVEGSCQEMTESIEGFQQRMMEAMPEEQRRIMQQMMATGRPQQVPEVVDAGTEQIANFDCQCWQVGTSRTVCISEDLQSKINKEMNNRYFADMQQRLGGSALMDKMGMSDPTEDAVGKLAKQGFVMKDVQAVTGIPGMNTAMLQFLPANKRAEIMKQMNLGADGAIEGPTVVSVDTNGAIPDIDITEIPAISFETFIANMMEQMKQLR